MSSLPRHVGIIMDGNGRWAKEHGLQRNDGHVEGLKRAREVTLACLQLGIPYLSLYVFSTENWRRTEKEVSFLMGLIRQHLKKEMDFYHDNKIRVLHSGDLAALPDDIQKDLLEVEARTENNQAITVNLLLNYGGQNEIERAAKRYLEEAGQRPFAEYLDHPEIPELDLVIRTAGEQRLSNFMLWKAAYAELYFTPKRWPEFTEEEFQIALDDFSSRKRNFGSIDA